jgi:penicillin V acylase-like amidase (Ntn superfamily)
MKKRFNLLSKGLLTLVFLSMATTANPCTRVLWVTADGHVYVGRTQDWTEKAQSSFRMYPRGIERKGAVKENPLTWTSKYGSLVLSIYDIGTHEGVNEKGLSAHVLYLSGETDFGKRNSKNPAIGISQWAQYFLDNFASVDEAIDAQKTSNVQIEPLILPNGFPSLVHISLEDKTGNSAIIEYIGGKAVIHKGKAYTVMTNEPTYDKQLENLQQYRTFGGDKPLPGERNPLDRFVRATFYSENLPQPTSPAEGVASMFSVIRNVSVPFGKPDPLKPNVSSTIFRSVIDLTAGHYYFESTYAPNIVWIDYSKLDFTAGKSEKELKVEDKIFGLNGDVSKLLKKAKPFEFGMNNN